MRMPSISLFNVHVCILKYRNEVFRQKDPSTVKTQTSLVPGIFMNIHECKIAP